jgi:hypothetical protein
MQQISSRISRQATQGRVKAGAVNKQLELKNTQLQQLPGIQKVSGSP